MYPTCMSCPLYQDTMFNTNSWSSRRPFASFAFGIVFQSRSFAALAVAQRSLARMTTVADANAYLDAHDVRRALNAAVNQVLKER